MGTQKPRVHRAAAAAFFFICGCIFATWAVRIPSIKVKFQLNEAQLGGILFLLPFGSLLALPFAGWVVGRLGSRIMLLISSLGYAALLIAIGHAGHPWVLGALLFLFGFVGDTLNIAMNTQGLQVQSEFYKRSLMSSFHGLWSVGAMTGAAAGGWFINLGLSTQQHFYAIALLILLLSFSFFPYLIQKDSRHDEQPLFAWPDKALWLLGAICFCCTMCEGAMADWSALYYQQVNGNLIKISSTGYTAYAFMMAFGRLVGDRVTERLGYRGMLMLDALLISGGLTLAIATAHPVPVILGFALVGLGVGTVIPIVYTLAWKNSSMATSAALAAVSTVGFSGFLVGPPVIGLLAHAVSLRWALLLILLLSLVILLLARKVRV